MRISTLTVLATTLLAALLASAESADPLAPPSGAPEMTTPDDRVAAEGSEAPESEPPDGSGAPADPLPEDAEATTGERAGTSPVPEDPAPAAELAEAGGGDPAPGDATPAEAAPATGDSARELGALARPPRDPSGGVLGVQGYDSQGRAGRIHIVVPGDTLWWISEAYLGTPWVWPSIWNDNGEIENPHRIYPGDHIWISPWEMRRLTPAEAEALMAGTPAEQAPAEPDVGKVAPPPVPLARDRITRRVSSLELVGLVSEEALESSASIVESVPTRVMLGQGDRVYVGLGADEVASGDEFTVFRTREKVFDPETGRMLGYHIERLGWLEVKEPHEEASVAEVRMSNGEINLGDRLMRREPPVLDIPILDSPARIDGRISFFANLRTLMGSDDFVYLNRGDLDGVQVGSPLEVYRQGFQAVDEARGEKVRVPERVVAYLLVVRTQANSSVAVVLHTEEELAVGDHVRGMTRPGVTTARAG